MRNRNLIHKKKHNICKDKINFLSLALFRFILLKEINLRLIRIEWVSFIQKIFYYRMCILNTSDNTNLFYNIYRNDVKNELNTNTCTKWIIKILTFSKKMLKNKGYVEKIRFWHGKLKIWLLLILQEVFIFLCN